MKLSLNWIKKYVTLPQDLTLEKLSHDLTMSTVEVEGIEDLGKSFNNIVAGKIKEVMPHPQADRLRIVIVDIGEETDAQIVCGGSNLEISQDVVVAKPGSFVTWHGEGEKVEIKNSKLRGVPSYGMICASSEIGLSDLFPEKGDHEIMDITHLNPTPGTNIADLLDLRDYVLEIDNKSMTNRPDLWCHYGMARELAAIYKTELKPLEKENFEIASKGYDVKIENEEKCRRFANLTYKGVENTQSPFKMQLDLTKVGIRPINILVDITNYAMMTTGNPTHAYDMDHIKGEIVVRDAKDNEKLTLLSSEELELSSEDLVIADEEKAVGLAGIMGGKNDSILDSTKDIIIEVANFDKLTVRHTATKYQLRSESSIRFEKGIDASRVYETLGYMAHLMKTLQPQATLTGFTDVYPVKDEKVEIVVSLEFLQKRLGKSLDFSEINKTLTSLGMICSLKGDDIIVKVPSYRATGDLSLPEDILEEIGRIIGYENFDYIPPTITLESAVEQKELELERRVREYFAIRGNMQEIFTYPWSSDLFIEASGMDKSDFLELEAPPSPNQSALKMSLVPNLIEASEKNIRYFDEFRIFEMSQVFKKGETHPSSDEETLPILERYITASLVGTDAAKLFRDAKGIVESMASYTHMKEIRLNQVSKPSWADAKVWLNILLGEEVIGSIGLLNVKGLKTAGIKHHFLAIIDLNFEKLKVLPSRTNKFEALPEFPLVEKDLSIIVSEEITWEEIRKVVAPKVKEVKFYDEYKGKQIEKGKKSITFKVFLESKEGTMTSSQIDEILKNILNKINKKFGGDLRTQSHQE